MAHLATQERRPARHLVTVRLGPGDGRLELGGERGAHALIGVERQYPVAGRERECEILLRAEAVELAVLDTDAALARNALRVILAAAVDHDALVAERQRVEAGADI